MADEDTHNPYCDVWQHMSGGGSRVDNTKKCSCGLRERTEKARQEMLSRTRPLRPLGMPEADWLRTLGIKPEAE